MKKSYQSIVVPMVDAMTARRRCRCRVAGSSPVSGGADAVGIGRSYPSSFFGRIGLFLLTRPGASSAQYVLPGRSWTAEREDTMHSDRRQAAHVTRLAIMAAIGALTWSVARGDARAAQG